ncbi:MAG: FtsX-like permease family protein [Acidobacteria bacterium]|nr:FtsX-like permease family protein [Acidobacteriota bacterium]
MRLPDFLRHRRREEDLDAEIRFHLEQQVDDLRRQGLSEQEARRRARREFGGVELAKEECRDERPLRWLADLVRDLRYAARGFLRSPGFTLVAVLTLALGVGANTGMFTLVRRVLLQTLPVSRPERLVELSCINTNEPDKVGCRFSYPALRLYEGAPALSSFFGFVTLNDLNVVHDGNSGLASAMLAGGDIYATLGVTPALGRLFNRSDDDPAAAPAAVLSYGFWQRRFGGDPAIVGSTLRLNTRAVTVIGITPPAFRGITVGSSPDITMPLGSAAEAFYGQGSLQNSGNQWLRVLGRLADGVSLSQAQAGLEPVFAGAVDDLIASLPPPVAVRAREYFQGVRFLLRPASGGGASEFQRDLDGPLRVLMGAVGVVLLLACVNLASMLLARTTDRRREVGVRLSLGASRLRLARQFLAESLLLSLAGVSLGLASAGWVARAVLTMASGDAPLDAIDLTPDGPTLLFTAGVAVLATVLMALGPLWRITRTDPLPAVRGGTEAGPSTTLSRALAPLQAALAVILLIGAGLFVRTFESFRQVDLGFLSADVVTFQVRPGLAGYDGPRAAAYFRELRERLLTLPNVAAATYSSEPMGGLSSTTLVNTPGLEAAPVMEHTTGRNRVAEDFVRTNGLRLLAGRDFAPGDAESASRAAIVNESFARHFLGTVDVVGREIAFNPNERPYTIVGLTADARDRGPKNPAERVIYTPFAEQSAGSASFAVRAQGSETALLSAVAETVKQLDPTVPVWNLATLDARLSAELRRERMLAVLGTLFGGLALLLVALGFYGLIAQAAARRTKEMGIRLAVGAGRWSVLWIFVRQGLWLTGIGLAAGLAAGAFLTRFVSSRLHGVTPFDPVAFGVAAGALLLVALVAVCLPALRALRADPLVSLRSE